MLMFVFFLAILLLATLIDNANRINVEERFADGENTTELILAHGRSE